MTSPELSELAEVPETSALPTRRDSLGIAVASGVTALATFCITLVVGRSVDTAGYAEFYVFWALLYCGFAVVTGTQNESTRAASVARARSVPGPRLQAAALVLGVGVAVAAVASSPFWAPRLTPATSPEIVPAVAVAIVLYAVFQTLLGTAGGLGQWRYVSRLMVIDGAARLGCIAVAGLLGLGLAGLEFAAVAAGLAFVVVLTTTTGRRIFTARADVDLGALLRRMGLAMVSSTSTGLLVVTFPAIMKLTNPHAPDAVMGGTLTAISLTRSPIMIPLMAFQSVAIAAFVAHGTPSLRPLAKPLLAVMGLAAIGAPAAGWAGPWILHLIKPTLHASGWTFAGLLGAAVPLAAITLTGAAAIAIERHVAFAAGWVAAAAVATALLLLPLDLAAKTVIALAVGPLVGVGIHVAAILGAARSARAMKADQAN